MNRFSLYTSADRHRAIAGLLSTKDLSLIDDQSEHVNYRSDFLEATARLTE
jgi:hypothetical protein